jgi:hypothetical protein
MGVERDSTVQRLTDRRLEFRNINGCLGRCNFSQPSANVKKKEARHERSDPLWTAIHDGLGLTGKYLTLAQRISNISILA